MEKLIDNPPENWLENLRRGHKVWLTKEQEWAEIEFPYEPPEPGYRTGRIGISRFSNNTYRGIESWFISSNGEGIDGSQLMQPIEGNLPDNPKPLPEPIVRQMQRIIDHLNQRVDALEQTIQTIYFLGLIGLKDKKC